MELRFERASIHFEAESPEEFIDMFAELYVPLLQARNVLRPVDRWEPLRNELITLSADANIASDRRFRAASDYLVIVARKAG